MSVFTGTASGHLDFLDKMEDALCDVGHAWGRGYVGTGNGKITGFSGDEGGYVGGAGSIAESFEITALTATTFSVVGSVSGSLGTATAGTNFVHAKLNFLITVGGIAFIAGDKFTLNTSPPWVVVRKIGVRNSSFLTSNMTNGANLWDTGVSTFATHLTASLPAYGQMELLWPVEVKRFDIQNNTIANAPTAWTLDWSDNGSSWTTHQTWTGQTWLNTGENKMVTVTGSPGAHKYWRVTFTAAPAGTMYVGRIWFSNDVQSNFNMTDRAEIIFNAPGLDGTKEILMGGRLYEDTSLGTYNLSWYAMRAFNPLFRVNDQLPDVELVSLPMTNQPFTYWMFVNGQRLITILKIGSTYVSGYFGFGFPYDLPSVHDWPTIMAAAGNSETRKVDNTDPNQRSIADPGRYGMKAWYPISGWRNHSNVYNSSNTDQDDTTTQGGVWPAQLTKYSSVEGHYMRDDIDGSLPLLPCVLTHMTGPKHIWGEMDGVFVTTGFNNTVESVITRGGFAHKVFQNLYRTTINDYFAVRMD